MTRAAGYLRVSTEEQAREGYSLDAQRRAIAAYCQAHSWELVEVYADEGRSGKDIAGRPALRRLLADARQRCFDAVIVWKLDRLGRRVRWIAEMCDDLEAGRVALVSIMESFDTGTATGRAFRNLLATFAELERDQMIERVRWGLQEKARQGQLLGKIPVGYRREGDSIVEDPATAPLVREMFRRYAAGGCSLRAMLAWVDQVGWRSPGGRRWSEQLVRSVLRNPSYTGRVRLHGADGISLIPGQQPALISVETFEAVQAILSDRGAGGRYFAREPYPLTGVLTCGSCGGPALASSVTERRGLRYRYHRCRTHGCSERLARADHLEAQLADYLSGMRLPTRLIQRAYDEYQRRRLRTVPDVDRGPQLRSQLERLKRLYLMGDLDEADYRARRDELQRQLEALAPVHLPPNVDVAGLVARIRDVGSAWRSVPAEKQRLAAHEIFAGLVVHDRQLVTIAPRQRYVPLFEVDRRLRFGQVGPLYPAVFCSPAARPGSNALPTKLIAPELRIAA